VHDQLVIAGIGNNPKNLGMQMHWKYFAPRLGFAYRFSEKTVIRGGFGISYTPFPDNTYAYNYPVRSNNQYDAPTTYSPAQYPDGTIATFQRGFPPPSPVIVPSNGIITNPDPTSTYYIIPLDWQNPYMETWSFAVQRLLPAHFTFDLAYAGSHGVHTPAQNQLNASRVPGAGSAGDPQYPRIADTVQYFQGFSSSY